MPDRSVLDVLENTSPVIVEYNESVINVAKAMVMSGEHAALVVKDEKMVGIVTESDLLGRILLTERNIRTTQIQSVMTTDTVIIKPEGKFGQALYLMHEYKVNHIPVVKDGKPLGVISISESLISDVAHYAHQAEMLDHIAEIL